ncbi:unnamed protein product [Boreogadus saida]
MYPWQHGAAAAVNTRRRRPLTRGPVYPGSQGRGSDGWSVRQQSEAEDGGSCFPAVTTGARFTKNQQTPPTDELETPGSRRPLRSSKAPEGNPLNGGLRVRELADTSRPEQKSCKYIGFSCLTLHPSPSDPTQPGPSCSH